MKLRGETESICVEVDDNVVHLPAYYFWHKYVHQYIIF